MNNEELKESAGKVADGIGAEAKKAGAWAVAHPEVMKALSYTIFGIVLGYVFFH